MSTKKQRSESIRKEWLVWLIVGLLLVSAVWLTVNKNKSQSETSNSTGQIQLTDHKYLQDPINLPEPAKSGRMSLEQAIYNRRSRREFSDRALTMKQLSQILWSMQGVTADWGGRTTPSAKEAYPLELYIVVNNVEGLEPGSYHYIPGELDGNHHQIGWVKSGNLSGSIEEAVVQSPAKGAPVVLVITANFEKMKAAFDNKPMDNNVYLEVGHAAQNLYLQIESLGLGMVTIGGFDSTKIGAVIGSQSVEKAVYAIPIGYPK